MRVRLNIFFLRGDGIKCGIGINVVEGRVRVILTDLLEIAKAFIKG